MPEHWTWRPVALLVSVGALVAVTFAQFAAQRRRLLAGSARRRPWQFKRPERFYPFLPPRGVMNIRPAAEEPLWIDVDTEYAHALELKKTLLMLSPEAVLGKSGHSLEDVAAREVLRAVLGELHACHPGLVHESEDRILNRVTGSSWTVSLTPPLVIAAQLVQEDLVVMLPDAERSTFVFACGAVCFADRWSIEEKIGKTLREIHEPVPQYAAIASASETFFQRFSQQKGIRVRYNYALQQCASLHLPEEELIDPNSADVHAAELYIRVERQSFRALPETGGILFTIRTYISPLADIPANVRKALRYVVDGKAQTSVTRDHIDIYRGALMTQVFS